jgi:hypothetical protein
MNWLTRLQSCKVPQENQRDDGASLTVCHLENLQSESIKAAERDIPEPALCLFYSPSASAPWKVLANLTEGEGDSPFLVHQFRYHLNHPLDISRKNIYQLFGYF